MRNPSSSPRVIPPAPSRLIPGPTVFAPVWAIPSPKLKAKSCLGRVIDRSTQGGSARLGHRRQRRRAPADTPSCKCDSESHVLHVGFYHRCQSLKVNGLPCDPCRLWRSRRRRNPHHGGRSSKRISARRERVSCSLRHARPAGRGLQHRSLEGRNVSGHRPVPAGGLDHSPRARASQVRVVSGRFDAGSFTCATGQPPSAPASPRAWGIHFSISTRRRSLKLGVSSPSKSVEASGARERARAALAQRAGGRRRPRFARSRRQALPRSRRRRSAPRPTASTRWRRAWPDPPDVILSDVQMPRMDGWQLVRIIRARSALVRRSPCSF